MKKIFTTMTIFTFLFSGIGLPTQQTHAATNSWNLTTPAEYTVSDTAKIVLDGTLGRLRENITPVLLGTYAAIGTSIEIVLSSDGTKAYMINRFGLRIIDVTNPATPTLLGTYDTSGNAEGVTLSSDGTKAYVADRDSGLHIIDVTNPATPTLLGTYDTSGSAVGTALSPDGTKAYVADRDSGLHIIDVTNPATPTLLGTYDTSGNAEQVVLSPDGTKAYVADGNSNLLLIIDVTNPATPTLLGTYDNSGNTQGITLSSDGTKAYVASFGTGLQIIDITNSATPTLLGNYGPLSFAFRLTLSSDNTKIYVTDIDNEWHVIDVINPAITSLIGMYSYPVGVFPTKLVLSPDGNNAYTVNSNGDLEITDVTSSYPSDSPYITANIPTTFTQQVETFSETLGANSQGSISYQISTDNGTIWNYWDGTAWTPTAQTDGTQTSSASDINTHIATLDTDGGDFLWRAYLTSDGTQRVSLDQIDISYDVPVVSEGRNTRKGGSIRFTCGDPSASNYSRFGRHKQSKCTYTTGVISTETPTNPFDGEECPAYLIIANNMKNGDTNGVYSSYNKGIVTDVSILQTHINRLLVDEYGPQAAGPVDDYFRSQTKRGVERLQLRLNHLLKGKITPLKIDGIVGPFTRGVINHSCSIKN